MKRPELTQILLVAVALGGAIALYAPYLSAHWSISPFGDTIYLTGPLFCDISRSVMAGVSPLMNWSTFEALNYNPHVAPYYPFYLFGWLDFCSATAAAQATDIIVIVHVAIFSITMTSLIRATGAGLVASIGGAAIAATLPNTYTISNFPTFIAAAAWLPLATEGIVRLYYHRQFALGALLLAAGTSAMLTAGPGTNLLSALVLIGLVLTVDTLVRLAASKEGAIGHRLAAALIAAAGITAILCLASTINLFSHISEIIRWTRSGAVVGQAGTTNITEILTEQQSWRDLPQLLVPINLHFAAGYYLLGPAAALLAFLGAVRGWSKPVVRVFAILVILSIVLVFLSPSKVVLLWALIPGLSHTRHLSLVATPLAVGISVLTAHGLASLLYDIPKQQQRSMVLRIGCLAILVASVIAVMSTATLRSVYPIWFLGVITALSAILFAVLTWIRSGMMRRLGAAFLLVLQFAFVVGSMPRFDGTPAVVRTELWRSIEAALDHIRKSDPDPGRIAMHTSIESGDPTDVKSKGRDLNYLKAGTAATYMGFTTFSHYTSPRIYWKFRHEIGLVGKSNFGPYGGKYLLSMVPLPDTLGKEVFRTGAIGVFLLNRQRPLVATICPKPDELKAPDASNLKTPPGQLPLLEGALVQAVIGFQDGRDDCPADLAVPPSRIDREANALDFSIPPGPERILVISMPPYSSWQLWVGGRRLPLYNLREQQVVAFVPANVSGRAMLRYRPNTYEWRVRISELGWVVVMLTIVGVLVWPRLRSNPSPPTPKLNGSWV
ncbi:hypothetical protein [Phyllobacterium sophorae]|nr:hypothetical protein [Phyllobacterium sophorae]